MGHLLWDTITSKLPSTLQVQQLTGRLGIGVRKDTDQATKWYEKVNQSRD
jgi:TPR repeat protein